MNQYCKTCGHDKSSHIYEEGACRPGFVCEASCEKFVANIQKQTAEEAAEAFAVVHGRQPFIPLAFKSFIAGVDWSRENELIAKIAERRGFERAIEMLRNTQGQCRCYEYNDCDRCINVRAASYLEKKLKENLK